MGARRFMLISDSVCLFVYLCMFCYLTGRCRVGWGMTGVSPPQPSRGSRGASWGPLAKIGHSSGRKRIFAYFEGQRTLLFVPIWQICGRHFALAFPIPNCGALSPWSMPMGIVDLDGSSQVYAQLRLNMLIGPMHVLLPYWQKVSQVTMNRVKEPEPSVVETDTFRHSSLPGTDVETRRVRSSRCRQRPRSDGVWNRRATVGERRAPRSPWRPPRTTRPAAVSSFCADAFRYRRNDATPPRLRGLLG